MNPHVRAAIILACVAIGLGLADLCIGFVAIGITR